MLKIGVHVVPRLTIELTEEEHSALKLLALVEQKKLMIVLKEAVISYLEAKRAFELTVTLKEKP